MEKIENLSYKLNIILTAICICSFITIYFIYKDYDSACDRCRQANREANELYFQIKDLKKQFDHYKNTHR